MENIDFETLEIRLEITGVAVNLYVEQDGSFTFKQIAKELDMDVADLFDYFPNKKAILEFYYTSLPIRYRLMIDEIEDFDSYTLSEKLSNLAYATFDMMNEKQDFVAATYNSLVRYRFGHSVFAEKLESIIRSFFEEDNRISTGSSLIMNDLFFGLMRNKFLYLFSYWIKDKSEDKEKSMELTDKLTAFIQEVMYSSIADRGFDLAKFLFSNASLSCSNPLWDKISSKIEIR